MNIQSLSVDVCIVKAIFLYVNAQMYVMEQSHLPLTVKKFKICPKCTTEGGILL
jgi:hypothetical protein